MTRPVRSDAAPPVRDARGPRREVRRIGYPAALVLIVVLSACTSTSSAPPTTSTPDSSSPSTSPTTHGTSLPAPPSPEASAGFAPAAVSFINADDGWVLGRRGCADCAVLRGTTDGGRSWSDLGSVGLTLSEDAPDSEGVGNVVFADPRDGYLFGPDLETTHDGGGSWTRSDISNVSQLTAADGTVFAVTQPAQGSAPELLRSPVGQDRWTQVALPSGVNPDTGPLGQGKIVQLAVEGPRLVILAPGFQGPRSTTDSSDLGQMWSSLDEGDHWQPVSVPCQAPDGGAAVLAIAFGHDDAWLLDCFDDQQSSQAQRTRHHLYGTADAGRSWVRLADPTTTGDPELLADNGAGHAFLTTVGGGGDWLDATFDAARHWRPLFSSGGSFFEWSDLMFVDSGTGFVVGPIRYGPEHLYRTDDGGRTWRTLTTTY